MANRLQEQTRGGIARDDDAPGVAAVEECLAVIEGEARFAFPAGAVALVAILREDGADFGFEELYFGGQQSSLGSR